MNSNVGGTAAYRVASPIEIMIFFPARPSSFVSLLRSSRAYSSPLRRRPSCLIREGGTGDYSEPHCDCRDRLTHENVIRISLLPTALRNDCSTSLCNASPLFPLRFSPPLSCLSTHGAQFNRSRPSITRDPDRARSRSVLHSHSIVGQLSQKDRPA